MCSMEAPPSSGARARAAVGVFGKGRDGGPQEEGVPLPGREVPGSLPKDGRSRHKEEWKTSVGKESHSDYKRHMRRGPPSTVGAHNGNV
jgi:hypothetical protein